MEEGWVALLIPIAAIVGGCTIAVVSTITNARIREARIRERIAMIEKGLVPAPEADPRGFDRHMERDERSRRHTPEGLRRGGIIVIAVGLGLMLMIGLAGRDVRSAIGVGGFVVVLGLAFLVNSLVERSARRRDTQTLVPPESPQGSKPI
jgi:hypothetical protein